MKKPPTAAELAAARAMLQESGRRSIRRTFRFTEGETQALDAIAKADGADNTKVVVRLILEEAARRKLG